MPRILAVLLMAAAGSKPFDYAQDVTKQLLTLSTAVVTITVAFLKDVTTEVPVDARIALYLAWAFFAAAIVSGVSTLLNLTGRVPARPIMRRARALRPAGSGFSQQRKSCSSSWRCSPPSTSGLVRSTPRLRSAPLRIGPHNSAQRNDEDGDDSEMLSRILSSKHRGGPVAAYVDLTVEWTGKDGEINWQDWWVARHGHTRQTLPENTGAISALSTSI